MELNFIEKQSNKTQYNKKGFNKFLFSNLKKQTTNNKMKKRRKGKS